MAVLLTRLPDDNARIAAELAARGIESLAWPLSRIDRLVDELDLPPGTEALLFTSARGVEHFAALSPVRDLPALCVGARTRQVALAAGFATAISAEGDVDALVALATMSGWRRFLHPCGAEPAGDLPAALAALGLEVTRREIYRSRPAGPPPDAVAEALRAGTVRAVTIWSPRNGARFAEYVADQGWRMDRTDLIAISDNAAAPLAGLAFRCRVIAARPSGAGMLDAIAATLRQ